MAPTAPRKRPSARAKATLLSKAGSGSGITKRAVSASSFSTTDGFINSKRDKRTIKSSAFQNRVAKSHEKKPLKRRRPSKKLVATLESLADALPALDDVEETGDALAGAARGLTREGKIKMRGLSGRPGAMKRKEKMEREERERFGKNLDLIVGAQAAVSAGAAGAIAVEGEGGEPAAPATVGRFAALRNWASQNMEMHPGFAKGA